MPIQRYFPATSTLFYNLQIFITDKTKPFYQPGLLAQLVEHGADNAKAVSSSLTQTNFFKAKMSWYVFNSENIFNALETFCIYVAI